MRFIIEGGSGNRTKKPVPAPYRHDMARALDILGDAGCSDIYVFGPLTEESPSSRAEIDLAVKGCPDKHQFFRAFGRLTLEMEHPVDLVDLDSEHNLSHYLRTEGKLFRVR